jgi:hypothetical protein
MDKVAEKYGGFTLTQWITPQPQKLSTVLLNNLVDKCYICLVNQACLRPTPFGGSGSFSVISREG